MIRRQQATNFAPAIRLAEKLVHPLNQFVTLNFNHTACPPEAASAVFARLRDNHFGPWVRRPPRRSGLTGSTPAFVWVIENTNGHTAAHWLLHVPPPRLADFTAKFPQWLHSVTGGLTCAVSSIDIRAAYRPFGARKYMLKGIDPAFADFYGIRHVPQGLVHGKRCGFSRSLGPTACRRNRTYYRQMCADGYRRYSTPASAQHKSL